VVDIAGFSVYFAGVASGLRPSCFLNIEADERDLNMPRGRRAGGANNAELAGLELLIQQVGQQLGVALGQALVAGMSAGVQSAGGLEGALRGRTSAAVGGSPCHVPACTRRAVAKGLCATHYRKARRLNMNEPFDAKALDGLAEDGRKTRFAKR